MVKAIETCKDTKKEIVKTNNDNADACQKAFEQFKKDKKKCYEKIKDLENSNSDKTNIVHKMEITLLQFK